MGPPRPAPTAPPSVDWQRPSPRAPDAEGDGRAGTSARVNRRGSTGGWEIATGSTEVRWEQRAVGKQRLQGGVLEEFEERDAITRDADSAGTVRLRCARPTRSVGLVR
eukprot:9480950-Pyramimonas_sp.AAC.2